MYTIRPDLWIEGMTVVDGKLNIPLTAFPEISAEEADPATGSIHNILFGILTKLSEEFESYEIPKPYESPIGPNFYIAKTQDTTDLLNVKTIFSVGFKTIYTKTPGSQNLPPY